MSAWLWRVAVVLLAAAIWCRGPAGAQEPPQGAAAIATNAGGPAPAGPFGFAVKRPVMAAACPSCPWGVVADKLKEAMAPFGYDIQICYSCARDVNMRVVSARSAPPAELTASQVSVGMTTPPNAPADFGATTVDTVIAKYNGTGAFADSGPFHDLRLIAKVTTVSYLLVGIRDDSLINDLSDIVAKKIPARILVGGDQAQKVLDYYKIDKLTLQSWGGSVDTLGVQNPNRDQYSVIIGALSNLNNSPESGIWYRLSQISNMKFLQLPEPLLQSLAGPDVIIRDAPANLVKGMNPGKPLRSAVNINGGTAIYGLANMPDSFVYDAAKALDVNQKLLRYSSLPSFYEADQVWNAGNVPLHPAAERYYRERKYISSSSRRAGLP